MDFPLQTVHLCFLKRILGVKCTTPLGEALASLPVRGPFLNARSWTWLAFTGSVQQLGFAMLYYEATALHSSTMSTHHYWAAHPLKPLSVHAALSSALRSTHTSESDRRDQGLLGGLQDEEQAVQKQTNETYRFISDLMHIFCVAGTVEQAGQASYLEVCVDLRNLLVCWRITRLQEGNSPMELRSKEWHSLNGSILQTKETYCMNKGMEATDDS
eukprot:1161806-Pelagomonas_calceolata.AAC.6